MVLKAVFMKLVIFSGFLDPINVGVGTEITVLTALVSKL